MRASDGANEPFLVALVLASLIFIDTFAPFYSVRLVAGLLAATAFTFLVLALARGKIPTLHARASLPGALLAFLFYALASALWASKPEVSALHVFVALLIAVGAIILCFLIPLNRTNTLVWLGAALSIGFVLGTLFLLFELLSNQQIKKWLYNAFGVAYQTTKPGIYLHWFMDPSKQNLTRSIVPLVLFFWPAFMAAKGSLPRPFNRFVAYGSLLLAIAVALISPLAAVQVSLLTGIFVFALSRISLRWTAGVLRLAWICIVVAAIPLAILPYEVDKRLGFWLPAPAAHRAIIWHTTAKHIMRAPIAGIGADMTDTENRKLRKAHGGPQTGNKRERKMARLREPALGSHAHNVYLQVWLELGLIGAGLLALIGLSLLAHLRTLPEHIQPVGFAAFTSAAVVAGLSYGAWQTWYMASFALCFVFFVVGKQALEISQTSGDKRRLVAE